MDATLRSVLEKIHAYAMEFNLPWTDDTERGLICLLTALQETPHRLVGNRDPAVVAIDHVIDSLEALRLGIDFRDEDLADLGSGGGFPGIPLALFVPSISMTLIDSRAKASFFLADLVQAFPESVAERMAVVRLRAEEWTDEAPFDTVVTRAVGTLEKLAGYSTGLIKPGGRLVAYKGPSMVNEEKTAAPVLQQKKLKKEHHQDYILWSTNKRRCLVQYRKT